ncbi:MAG: DUF4271 domain-containing protein [Muribaculaceae bacterium]|nr:DUF4271 domain-containing protein [Muribaculaceae bacterium]
MEMQDSTRTTTVWQTENDIVVPVTVQEHVTAETSVAGKTVKTPTAVHKTTVKSFKGVPKLLAYPYTGEDVVAATTGPSAAINATDSIAADSVTTAKALPGEKKEGIILVNPASELLGKETHLPHIHWSPMSWIYLALALLFCVVAIKFKGNSRYMKALMSDLTSTRIRPNAFDDTVRETSLLVLLNIMWVACAGVMLWKALTLTAGTLVHDSAALPDNPAAGIAICSGVAAVYLAVMTMAYWVIGNVFADRRQTQMWVKGAAAAYGLETFLLFPLALLILSYPAWSGTMLIISGIVFIFGKIVFLYKGFRIFFTQISSWLLFLYYLCSLEIVPLILTYVAAWSACIRWM